MRDSPDPILADEGLRLAAHLAPRNPNDAAELQRATRREVLLQNGVPLDPPAAFQPLTETELH